MQNDKRGKRIKLIDGYWTLENASERKSSDELCSQCGAYIKCPVVKARTYLAKSFSADTKVSRCAAFEPIMAFSDQAGTVGVFNTFRMGQGWAKRLIPGAVVTLVCDTRTFGRAQVKSVHSGALGSLAIGHGHMNHMVLAYPHRTIRDILKKTYGANWSADDSIYSVIYMERVYGDADSRGETDPVGQR